MDSSDAYFNLDEFQPKDCLGAGETMRYGYLFAEVTESCGTSRPTTSESWQWRTTDVSLFATSSRKRNLVADLKERLLPKARFTSELLLGQKAVLQSDGLRLLRPLLLQSYVFVFIEAQRESSDPAGS
jgi:hypothetical protein